MGKDLHKTWPHRRLNSKAIVQSSPICARGVFAKEKISKSEVIRVTGGIILPKADVDAYNASVEYEVDNVYLDISDEFLMAPTQEDLDTTATINHSCDPNAGFLDTITIIAIKDIAPGTEVAWDYAFSQTTFEPFDCNCQTDACRKVIRPTDWQIKSIQKRHGEYFAPYLKSKI